MLRTNKTGRVHVVCQFHVVDIQPLKRVGMCATGCIVYVLSVFLLSTLIIFAEAAETRRRLLMYTEVYFKSVYLLLHYVRVNILLMYEYETHGSKMQIPAINRYTSVLTQGSVKCEIIQCLLVSSNDHSAMLCRNSV